MSLWSCSDHGLTGPDPCCPKAGMVVGTIRQTVATLDGSNTIDAFTWVQMRNGQISRSLLDRLIGSYHDVANKLSDLIVSWNNGSGLPPSIEADISRIRDSMDALYDETIPLSNPLSPPPTPEQTP